MRAWLERNIAEIEGDRALGLYGACIAATHLMTFQFWRGFDDVPHMLAKDADVVCWPFFEGCYSLRVLQPSAIGAYLWLYALAALAAAVLFLRSKTARAAFWALLATEGLKLAMLVQDFRLKQNHHLMALFISIPFLFFPDKRKTLSRMLCALYFWAGTLKLHGGWTDGGMFFAYGVHPLFIESAPLVRLACVYVVVLELALVWGLLSRSVRVQAATWLQLMAFHVESWPIVGWFYPLLMFALLAIVPLGWAFPAPERRAAPSLASAGLLTGFCLLQLVPQLFPGDDPRGERRMFSLYMYHSLTLCDARLVERFHGGGRRFENITDAAPHVPPRLRCEPNVFYELARQRCRRLSADGAFEDLDLAVRAKDFERPGPLALIVDAKDFCREKL